MKQQRNVYNEVTNFAKRGYENDGSYAFTAGVYESVLISALEQLPKRKREVLLDRLAAVDAKFFTKKAVA